jgi:hypothetical protein
MLTWTRETAGLYPDVTVPSEDLAAVSAGPIHSGRLPARTEPAEGPAAIGTGFDASALDVTVAARAVGHETGG